MGVTIGSKNKSIDMGYVGFNKMRQTIANLINDDLGKLYEKLPMASFSDSELKEYNKKLNELQEKYNISDTVLDFLYQSDCTGSIDSECAQELVRYIGDYDDNICYGYVGQRDCAMFRDFKEILKECVSIPDSDITWY